MNFHDLFNSRSKRKESVKTKLKNKKKSSQTPKRTLTAVGEKKGSSGLINVKIKRKSSSKQKRKESSKEKQCMWNIKNSSKNVVSTGFFLKTKNICSTKSIHNPLTNKKMSLKQFNSKSKKRIEMLFDNNVKRKDCKSTEKGLKKKGRWVNKNLLNKEESSKTRSYSRNDHASHEMFRTKGKLNKKDLVNPKLRKKLQNLENKLFAKLIDNRKSLNTIKLKKTKELALV